jgi:hypothetical protein
MENMLTVNSVIESLKRIEYSSKLITSTTIDYEKFYWKVKGLMFTLEESVESKEQQK